MGFGKNRAACYLHEVADAVERPWGTFAITYNAGKRRKEGADLRNNMKN